MLITGFLKILDWEDCLKKMMIRILNKDTLKTIKAEKNDGKIGRLHISEKAGY
jgi:hypothetical protein